MQSKITKKANALPTARKFVIVYPHSLEEILIMNYREKSHLRKGGVGQRPMYVYYCT